MLDCIMKLCLTLSHNRLTLKSTFVCFRPSFMQYNQFKKYVAINTGKAFTFQKEGFELITLR